MPRPPEPNADTSTAPPATPPSLSGAELLNQLRAALGRYVVLPSEETADAVTLWIAATHAQPAWAHAPRLVIRAPEKRCGKSRLLDVVEATSWLPLITVNASPAAVYRSLGGDDPPTLLIDEADTIFGGKAGESNEDLRGLLNAGHQRNRPALRYDAARGRVERIPTFAMAALAGIGVMPDTIEDRAVVIRMRRRAPGETVAPFRGRRDAPALRELAAAVHRWLRANVEDLEHAAPPMPVEDRAADTWEPLIAVADLAGGDWPGRGRQACLTVTADHDASTDVPLRIRLLIDVRTAFGHEDTLPSSALISRLREDPEAPWDSYGTRGDGLTVRQLGHLLREYDIRPGNLRFPNGHQAKGYARTAFADAWTRYCPPETDANDSPPIDVGTADGRDPSQPSQPLHPRSDPGRIAAVGRIDPSQLTIRPALTSTGTAGTAGTDPSHEGATCIRCRWPLTHDDGTHTHPTCATA